MPFSRLVLCILSCVSHDIIVSLPFVCTYPAPVSPVQVGLYSAKFVVQPGEPAVQVTVRHYL